VQCCTAKQQHRQHHELGATVGNDGAADGRCNCVINDLHGIHLAIAPEIFAYPIKDHNRLIHRIAQNCEHRSQHRQGKLPLEKRKKSENNNHVMQVGNDCRYSKFPLESNGQIEHDANNHANQCLKAICGQFIADLRPDEFGAPQSGTCIASLQCGQHTLTLRA